MPSPLDLFTHPPPAVGPFHAHGSDTSRAAAERVRLTLEPRQQAVLRQLRISGPLTAEEIADRLGLRTAFLVMPRLTEMSLMQPPRVRKTVERRVNRSGSTATVWEAVP